MDLASPAVSGTSVYANGLNDDRSNSRTGISSLRTADDHTLLYDRPATVISVYCNMQRYSSSVSISGKLPSI